MATEFDFSIDQGAQYDNVFTFKDASGNLINFAGYTAKMQIAVAPGAAAVLTLQSGSGLTLSSSGTVTLVITGTQTAQLVGGTNDYAYDLLVTDPSGIPKRYLQGSITVSPRVTT